ncbi:MAG: RluA family pseudouridine synthase [Planctomycetes bacterium]|nr:RluA family pseudouridine synthase [Planctomycetota bacterium]MBU1518682.1 RluA family pseudouridine synthase [Planctomycetota bacterium]MBU2457914.1 RluA family pseudouridine synthase [Planctomycetota bacterium]
MSCNPTRPASAKFRRLPKGLEILYEDDDIIVVNKPAGLLTVKTQTDKTHTVQYILNDYIRKGNFRSRKIIFPVHRLDQWTSGVLIFAKSREVKMALQDQWQSVEKKYIAVVHGRLAKKQDIITSYLAENKAFVVYSTTDTKKGKLAKTAYTVLKESADLSLVEITLLTGRKNQIRVHFSNLGHPIAGDRKYGNPKDEYKRLALHAKSISFRHPTSGKQMSFTAKPPAFFTTLIRVG